MTDRLRTNRYRQLFLRLGEARALDLLDTLQVLALTRPDTVRELEAFIDRTIDLPSGQVPSKTTSPNE